MHDGEGIAPGLVGTAAVAGLSVDRHPAGRSPCFGQVVVTGADGEQQKEADMGVVTGQQNIHAADVGTIPGSSAPGPRGPDRAMPVPDGRDFTKSHSASLIR